ncbi:hypothetical protein [Neobacillus sp. CF12]|uniref:hypothetical protein n=1 Tax=Neobacillus sp. CF12 TaxID=3055864 RepID=UPI0025A2FC64|nr:hypothetical protein [Neobacillus sp. CF12]MDM5326826.1 hypothetical protein [Neobacillus sp. CF12]
MEGSQATLPISNLVVEVFRASNPDDKLVGITNYRGEVTFKIDSGSYEIVVLGNKYKYYKGAYDQLHEFETGSTIQTESFGN